MSLSKQVNVAKNKTLKHASHGEGRGRQQGKPKRGTLPFDVSDYSWDVVKPEDFTVKIKGLGSKEEKVEVIRRTVGADGQYLPKKSDPGRPPWIETASFRLTNKSFMTGCGNVNTMQGDDKVHFGNCKYAPGLACGNLSDGVAREGLLEKQTACMKKFEAITLHIMKEVFAANPPSWKKPIDKAVMLARLQMYEKYKDKTGKKLKSYLDMEALEKEDASIAKAVRAKARDMFIANARPLPGAPRKDDTGNSTNPVLYTSLKVWPFANFNKDTDRRPTETGPKDVPAVSLEYWGRIEAEMTDPKGLMRRKYAMLSYVDGKTGKEIERPKVKILKEEIDPVSGQRIMREKFIPDPFWCPAMIDQGTNRPLESLVACIVSLSVYGSNEEKYGQRASVSSPLTVVSRCRRRQQIALDKAEYTTGMDLSLDESSEDDEKKSDTNDENDAPGAGSQDANANAGADGGGKGEIDESGEPEDGEILRGAGEIMNQNVASAKTVANKKRGIKDVAEIEPNDDDDDDTVNDDDDDDRDADGGGGGDDDQDEAKMREDEPAIHSTAKIDKVGDAQKAGRTKKPKLAAQNTNSDDDVGPDVNPDRPLNVSALAQQEGRHSTKKSSKNSRKKQIPDDASFAGDD